MKKLTLIFIVALLMFIPFFNTFSQTKIKDNETIYILSDPYGNFEEKILVDWIRVKGKGKFEIEDPIRDLEKIRKMYGDGEIEVKDGSVIIKGESDGLSDTYYRGNYLGKIPFKIDVKYFLNGKEETTERIKGKSGKVKIEINGKSELKWNGEIVPLLAVVTASLDAEKIKNLNTSSDTKPMVMGRKYQVSLMLILDPEDEGFIEFESDNITLPEIIITVVPSYPSIEFPEVEVFDEITDGIDKLINLVKAQKMLIDETRKNLQEGLKRFDFSEFDKAVEGINLIKDILKSQSDIIFMLAQKIDEEKIVKLKELSKGVDSIILGLNKEKEGLNMISSLMDGYMEITNNILELNSASQKLAENIQSPLTPSLLESLRKEESLIKLLLEGGALPNGSKVPSFKETKENINRLSSGIDEIINSLNILKQGLIGVNELVDGNIEMKKTLTAISKGGEIEGIKTPGLEGLSNNLNEIGKGLKTGLTTFSSELNNQFSNLIETLKTLSSSGYVMGKYIPGLSLTLSGMNEMKKGVSEGKKEFEKKEEETKRKREIVKKVKTFIGSPKNSDGSVEFIIKINP